MIGLQPNMDQMNEILLLGANGQLGSELSLSLPVIGNLIKVTRQTTDLTNNLSS